MQSHDMLEANPEVEIAVLTFEVDKNKVNDVVSAVSSIQGASLANVTLKKPEKGEKSKDGLTMRIRILDLFDSRGPMPKSEIEIHFPKGSAVQQRLYECERDECLWHHGKLYGITNKGREELKTAKKNRAALKAV